MGYSRRKYFSHFSVASLGTKSILFSTRTNFFLRLWTNSLSNGTHLPPRGSRASNTSKIMSASSATFNISRRSERCRTTCMSAVELSPFPCFLAKAADWEAAFSDNNCMEEAPLLSLFSLLASLRLSRSRWRSTESLAFCLSISAMSCSL